MTIPVPDENCECVITVMHECDGDKAIDYIKNNMTISYACYYYMTQDYYIFHFPVMKGKTEWNKQIGGLIDLVQKLPDYQSCDYCPDDEDDDWDGCVSSWDVKFYHNIDTETGNPVGEAYYIDVIPQGDYFVTPNIDKLIAFRDVYYAPNKVITYEFVGKNDTRICRTTDPLKAETIKRAFSDIPIWYEFWVTDNLVRLKCEYNRME